MLLTRNVVSKTKEKEHSQVECQIGASESLTDVNAILAEEIRRNANIVFKMNQSIAALQDAQLLTTQKYRVNFSSHSEVKEFEEKKHELKALLDMIPTDDYTIKKPTGSFVTDDSQKKSISFLFPIDQTQRTETDPNKISPRIERDIKEPKKFKQQEGKSFTNVSRPLISLSTFKIYEKIRDEQEEKLTTQYIDEIFVLLQKLGIISIRYKSSFSDIDKLELCLKYVERYF